MRRQAVLDREALIVSRDVAALEYLVGKLPTARPRALRAARREQSRPHPLNPSRRHDVSFYRIQHRRAV